MSGDTPARELQALDDIIRRRAADQLEDGEQIVNWLVIVGTRMFRPDPTLPRGTAGTVIAIPHMGAMPPWEAKGIITHYLDLIGGMLDDDSGDV
jgi:hypothetical protein